MVENHQFRPVGRHGVFELIQFALADEITGIGILAMPRQEINRIATG